jgi:imidazolonepropionase-like amidohydrolase
VPLFIRGGSLIDGTGADVRTNTQVTIADGRISSIDDDASIAPSDDFDDVIDAAGKFILPGLFNMHEHLAYRELVGPTFSTISRDAAGATVVGVRNAMNALSRGWTTVVDMGAPYGVALALRDAIGRGEVKGPRVLAVGNPICVTGGHISQAQGIGIEADGVVACQNAARRNLKQGADLLKAMASHDPYCMPGGAEQTRAEMTAEEIGSIFDEARRWGKPTSAHVMGTQAIHNVLDAGIDIVHHGVYLNEDHARRMSENGTFFCPTLSAYDRQTMHPAFGRGSGWAREHMSLVEPHQQSIHIAIEHGIKIVVGTDSTGSYAEEVDLLRGAGMNAMDTILASTRYCAEALGIDDEVGTISAGKAADIVIVDGDPVDDPYALQRVWKVIRDGRVYSPAELEFEEATCPTWIPRHLEGR